MVKKKRKKKKKVEPVVEKVDGRGRPFSFDTKTQKKMASVLKKHKGNATQARQVLLDKGFDLTLPLLIRIGKRHGVEMRKRGRPELSL